jgi:hypothetical protein
MTDLLKNLPTFQPNPETCPIVADISVYPLDHSDHTLKAGERSITTTLYSRKCDDCTWFFATFPTLDETLQIKCNGETDIGGKVVDHVYQPYKESSTWQMFRLVRCASDVIKKKVRVESGVEGGDPLYMFSGDLYIMHHPQNNEQVLKINYFCKKIGKFNYVLDRIVFKIENSLLNEILQYRRLDLERYFKGNPYTKGLHFQTSQN